jgi:hypothetical protein
LAQNPVVGINGGKPFDNKIEKSKTFENASVSCAHLLVALCGAEIMKQGGKFLL